MAKKVNKTDEQFANVEENLSKAGLFVVKNQKKLIILIGILIGIIASFAIFNKYYQVTSIWPIKIYSTKTINKSDAELSHSEFNFERDSFNLALNGGTVTNPTDSSEITYKGLTEITSTYPYTKAGNLANYYAAICQINLGSSDSLQYFEDALNSLDNFSTNTKSLSFKNMIKKYWWILLNICIICFLIYFIYFKKQKIRRFIPYILIVVILIVIYGVYFSDNSTKKSIYERILSSRVTGLKGDANMELGDTIEAMKFYKLAATDPNHINSLTTPYFMMKQAEIHKAENHFSLALEIYNTIKSDYPKSKEGKIIDKYITSVSNRK